MRPSVQKKHASFDLLSSPIMRVAAWIVAVLLVVAYLTGEEIQHTHVLLGYGLAAVPVAGVVWELLAPHARRSASAGTALNAARAGFRASTPSQFGGAASIASGLDASGRWACLNRIGAER